jgi:hypothetical protein
MDHTEQDRTLTPAHVLDAISAGLWPTLSAEDRREKVLRAFGLTPLAPWTDGRMVYVGAPPKA